MKLDNTIKYKLLSGAMWIVGAKFIAFPFGLALTALLTRLLDLEQVGNYFLIFSLVQFLAMVALFGMERTVVRYVSESLALDLPTRARNAIKHVLQNGLLTSVTIAFLLASGIGQIISIKIFDSGLMSNLIIYAAIWLILFTMQRLIAESFRGLHNIALAALFNGLMSKILTVISLGFIFFLKIKTDITLILSVIIISHLLNLIISFLLLLKDTRKLNNTDTDQVSRADILKTSWPIFSSFIFLQGLQYIQLWLLGYCSNKESVAIYGAVFRIMILISATLDIVRLVIPPMISRLYTERKYREVEKILRTTATFAGVPSGIVLLLMIFFGKTILIHLYGNDYAIGYTALLVLSTAYFVNFITGTPGVLLVMASKEKYLLLCALISGSIGIFISLLLVSSLDYLGVAIGTGIAVASQNLLMSRYCLKNMSINTFFNFRELRNINGNINYIFSELKNRLKYSTALPSKTDEP